MKLYILVDNNLTVSRIVSEEMAIKMYQAFLEDHSSKLKNTYKLAETAIKNLNPGVVYDLTFGLEEFGQTILTCVNPEL